MTTDIDIEIVGLKDALKILNSMDKSLRREITTEFKSIMDPVVKDAIQLVPTDAPLSGMSRVWVTKSNTELLPWSNVKASRQIKAFTSGKKVRDTGLGFRQNLAVFGIKWSGPGAQIFDMAGKAKPGSQLAKSLTAEFGSPSRAMWKAYERNADKVQDNVKALVNRVMVEANRLIGSI
jgi:hypothetical protein